MLTKQPEEENESYSKALYKFIALVEISVQSERKQSINHIIVAFTLSALSILI